MISAHLKNLTTMTILSAFVREEIVFKCCRKLLYIAAYLQPTIVTKELPVFYLLTHTAT